MLAEICLVLLLVGLAAGSGHLQFELGTAELQVGFSSVELVGEVVNLI